MAAPQLKSLAPSKVIEKLAKMKAKRGMFESLWQEIADNIRPLRDDVQFMRSPGEKKYVNMLDSVGMNSCELLAGSLHGMLTNPAGYFFGLSTGDMQLDQDDDVRIWLQKVVRDMHNVLNNSNFQTEVHEYYLDLIAFGFAPLDIQDDPEMIVRFCARAIKEVFIEENAKGTVHCVYRCFKWTATQIVEEFGEDACTDKIKKAHRDGKQDEYEIIHAVYPMSYVPGTNKSKFKFVSQYTLVAEKHDLEIKGFYELPYVVPRWSKASGEAYGRGCGEKGLPEAKVLNKMTETTLRGAQKVVDPPLQAPDDGFVMPLITKPGGFNYYRAGSQDRIEPIFNDARIDFGYQAIEMKQKQVREAFYIDQLKLREGDRMTAAEVGERTEQALRFLGPMLGRQQYEFLQPLISRVYSIMDRRGLIAEAPAILAEKPLKIQYTSVMAMSQRASELQNISRTMQQTAPFVALDPTVADVFNGTNAAMYIAKLLNCPQELINTKDDIDKTRKQRAALQAQQMQQMQEAEQAKTASQVAGAAAKFQPKQAG